MRIKVIIHLFVYLFIGLFLYLFTCLPAGRLPIAYSDSQTVNVSSTVIPHNSDFQKSISQDQTSTIPQNTTITYTVTYGSHLLYADQLKIEASWDQGTISGNTSSTISGLDYVTGSASQAYNNTTPVVDLTNNKIDWNISSFPANTQNKTVTFQLKTNSSYTGSPTVTFPISVKLINPNITTSSASVTTTCQYNAALSTPTPTSAGGPTNSPTPGNSPTSTPTPTGLETTPTPVLPQARPNIFSKINIFNLTSTQADIEYIANQQGNVTIFFGLSPQSITNQQNQQSNGYGIFNLTTLLPNTTYFFQLVSDGDQGKFSSEIFSFKTPSSSQIPEVVLDSLVIAAPHDILYSPELYNPGGFANSVTVIPTIQISKDTDYTIAFRLTKTSDIKSVEVILENNSILGIFSFAHAQNIGPTTYMYPVFDRGNGDYSANIINSLPSGHYIAYVRIVDITGNIKTQKIAPIHVLRPFSAFDSKTKKPIEDVRIVIYNLDPTTKNYARFPNLHGYINPIYTNKMGEATEQLPSGKYKVTFSLQLLGYHNVTKYFSIGKGSTDDYPRAYMNATPINFMDIVSYYTSAFSDWIALTSSDVCSSDLRICFGA